MKRAILVLVLFASITAQAQDFPTGNEVVYTPGDHELFLFPTAVTLPKGSFYFSSYELLFLNLGYAVTSTTHISVFSYFPITVEAVSETFTIGIKQQLWKTRGNQFITAVSGAYNLKYNLYLLSGHVSMFNQNHTLGFHGSLSVYRSSKTAGIDNQVLNVGFGVEGKATRKISLIAEYQQLSVSQIDLSSNAGLGTIGFRWKGEDLAIDFAGMRPLGEGSSSKLLFFPFIKGTFIF